MIRKSLYRRAHADMGGHERGEIDRFDLVQPPVCLEQTDSIPSNQSTQGIPDDAQFLDLIALVRELLEGLFDLVRDPLAAQFDSIVGIASGVALCSENI
jgi:hypothetical protein